jgi:hypothetical protein
MIGAADIGNCMTESGDFDEQAGITPRAVSELFRLLNERTAQVESAVEVQMFQLYRDNIEDLLKEKKKKKKDEEEKAEPPLKITLAEHSPTGLVYVRPSFVIISKSSLLFISFLKLLQVDGAESMVATTPGDVMKIFAKGKACEPIESRSVSFTLLFLRRIEIRFCPKNHCFDSDECRK